MVDIAWQRAKWFFFLKVFVGVLLSCFQSVFQKELELLNSVDILYLYGAFGILLVGFESFLLRNLFWVIGGQLIENQPLLRQIYKEPPIISYKRGRSLKDILVKAKLWELKAINTWVESVSQASLYHVICCNLSRDKLKLSRDNLATKENVMSLTGHRKH